MQCSQRSVYIEEVMVMMIVDKQPQSTVAGNGVEITSGFS